MVRKARIKIDIAGQYRPYTEGEWVVFSPSAFPVGFMHVERRHLHSGFRIPGHPERRMADERKPSLTTGRSSARTRSAWP